MTSATPSPASPSSSSGSRDGSVLGADPLAGLNPDANTRNPHRHSPAAPPFVSAETHKCASGYTTGLPQECKGTDEAGTFDGTTWAIGDMLAGEYASLFVTVTLNAGTDGKTLNNTAAFVNPPEYDQNPDNNIAKASISVKQEFLRRFLFWEYLRLNLFHWPRTFILP